MKNQMKKALVALGLAASLFLSSCMGSWGLTKAVYEWNDGVTGNKFVDNVLFWVLSPVYGFTIAVDFYIFNLIEFWTGSNPVAMAPGAYEKQNVALNGEEYLIEARKNQMTFTQLSNQEVYALQYLPESQKWQMTLPTGEIKELLSITEAKDAIVLHANGNSFVITQEQMALGKEGFAQAMEVQACN